MGSTRRNMMAIIIVLMMIQVLQQHVVHCYEYKVGDLDGWNIPSSANPNVYIQWSQTHTFSVGDSLFFLYPPSQDSVIMVTQQSYQSCNIQQHIFSFNDGNSIFNITCPGDFYFTSGEAGHCQSQQKLHITATGTGTCSFPPPSSSASSAAPSPLPLPLAVALPLPSGMGTGSSPSPSPLGLGNIPSHETSSSSGTALWIDSSPVLATVIALFIFA